jgi:phosphatidylinositol alpha-1,6-mannosyltransferase
VIVHGAEVTVPGRLPGSRQALGWVLRNARQVIAAGGYPAAEAEHAAGRSLDVHVVPPGVDVERFHPLSELERSEARRHFGFAEDAFVLVAVSRLVPRKGFDTAIEAVARLGNRFPNLTLAIAGAGRDRERLEKVARAHSAPVTFLGRIADDDLPRLYGCADLSVMLCRNRWGGLEQEGFGIVFLEAAACGVPQIAGASGGAAEAVADGVTGLVAQNPRSVDEAVEHIAALLDDESRRLEMGRAARRRAVEEFSYAVLSKRLGAILDVTS